MCLLYVFIPFKLQVLLGPSGCRGIVRRSMVIIAKVASMLGGRGGCGKKLSKNLGSAIYDVLMGVTVDADKRYFNVISAADTAAFDVRVPTVFPRSHVVTETLVNAAALTESVSIRSETDAAMTQNTKWIGAIGRLGVVGYDKIVEFMKPFMDADSVDTLGTCPFAVVNKSGCFRWGPSACPLPGIACLISVLGGVPENFVAVYPASGIIAQGIALKDAKAFLETASGEEYCMKHAYIVEMSDNTLYVPFGYCASPVYVNKELLERKAGGGAKALKLLKQPEWSHNITVPLYSTACAKKLDRNVWSAIVTWNVSHLLDKGGDAHWAARKECFEKFVAAVEE